ncbi:hypothetical protein IFVP177_C270142 [Vibrio parahaemolyticus]
MQYYSLNTCSYSADLSDKLPNNAIVYMKMLRVLENCSTRGVLCRFLWGAV